MLRLCVAGMEIMFLLQKVFSESCRVKNYLLVNVNNSGGAGLCLVYRLTCYMLEAGASPTLPRS